MARREKFYRNLNVKRAMLMASPFVAAALASQGLDAQSVSTEAQLRAAITAANGNTNNVTINLAAGTYNLTSGIQENSNGTGDLDITRSGGNITLQGAGAGVTFINAAQLDRIFHISATGTATYTVTIMDMTLQNGRARDNGTTGATGLNESWGGAILNDRLAGATNTNVTLQDVVIENCTALGRDGVNWGDNGSDALGGAIYSENGTVSMNNVTMTGNEADGGEGEWGSASSGGQIGGDGGVGLGGAVYLEGGNLDVVDSTISNNGALGGNGGDGSVGRRGGHAGEGFGGAIYLQAGTLDIDNSTLAENDATGGYGGSGAAGSSTVGAANGGDGGIGGDGAGGAVYVQAGTVSITNASAFSSNQATGGAGGSGGGGTSGVGGGQHPGGDGGPGGRGQGGAVYIAAGTVTINLATFSQNEALGGNTGNGGTGSDASTSNGGNGGSSLFAGGGEGGAIHAAAGTTNISQATISQNLARGGDGGYGGGGGSGYPDGGDGGGGGQGGQGFGGGVFVGNATSVALNLIDSTLSNNSAIGGDAGSGGSGSWGNTGVGGAGGAGGIGGSARGGGYYRSGGSSTLAITQCTISGNSVAAGNGGDGGNGSFFNTTGPGGAGGNAGTAQGGGVFVQAGNVNIRNSTIAGNSATQAGAAGSGGTGVPAGPSGAVPGSTGGGLQRVAGTMLVESTILADNTAGTNPDAAGVYTANFSLVENGQAPAGGSSNVLGTDPGLSALASNGGPTQTHAINNGAARNTGSNPLGLGGDQRGNARNDGGGVDMGAYEQGGGASATPNVTDPAGNIFVNAANYNVQGTAPANALIRIYRDNDDNGAINGADAVVGTPVQLTGGATAFSYSVPLNQNAANNFLATADNGTESTPVNVPTITEDSNNPAPPVVTTPATPTTATGANFNIIGTAEAGATVRIYSDGNNNGVVDGSDSEQASGVATGGNFNISTPIQAGTANNFTAIAEDLAGNQSTPTDVPTITENSVLTAAPTVTDPSSAISVNQADYDIQGTAVANSLVRVYRDVNNNGIIELPGDIEEGQQQLTGGATAFIVNVPLLQGQDNNFLATADDATSPESTPVDVPTITDTGNSGGGGGGGGGDGGGCSTGNAPNFGWLGLGAALAATFSLLRNLFRRREINA